MVIVVDRLRPEQEEQDDPTSSSENESLSDSDHDDPFTSTISQARAPSAVSRRFETSIRNRPTTMSDRSRILNKARSAILGAWQDVTAILHDEGRSTPWEGLLVNVEVVFSLSDKPKVLQDPALVRSTAVLFLVIQHRLMGLIDSNDKFRSYARSLARSEAKALTRFVKAWLKILETYQIPTDIDEHDLGNIRCDVLKRVAVYAITENSDSPIPPQLDVGSLEIEVGQTSGLDDVPLALSLFKVSMSKICSVDLSSNHLTSCPAWLFGVPLDAVPFRDLTSLDLSDNPGLKSIPLRIFRNRLSYLNVEDTPAYHGPGIRNTVRPYWRSLHRKDPALVPSSLLHFTIASLLRADPHRETDYDTLPPHLATLMKSSYLCDLCHSVCVPGYSIWLKKYSFRDPAVQVFSYRGVLNSGEGIQVEGRSCRLCI